MYLFNVIYKTSILIYIFTRDVVSNNSISQYNFIKNIRRELLLGSYASHAFTVNLYNPAHLLIVTTIKDCIFFL